VVLEAEKSIQLSSLVLCEHISAFRVLLLDHVHHISNRPGNTEHNGLGASTVRSDLSPYRATLAAKNHRH
jgi:hypothetical protein